MVAPDAVAVAARPATQQFSARLTEPAVRAGARAGGVVEVPADALQASAPGAAPAVAEVTLDLGHIEAGRQFQVLVTPPGGGDPIVAGELRRSGIATVRIPSRYRCRPISAPRLRRVAETSRSRFSRRPGGAGRTVFGGRRAPERPGAGTAGHRDPRADKLTARLCGSVNEEGTVPRVARRDRIGGRDGHACGAAGGSHDRARGTAAGHAWRSCPAAGHDWSAPSGQSPGGSERGRTDPRGCGSVRSTRRWLDDRHDPDPTVRDLATGASGCGSQGWNRTACRVPRGTTKCETSISCWCRRASDQRRSGAAVTAVGDLARDRIDTSSRTELPLGHE